MESIVFGMALMSTGTLFFELIPGPMLRVFSQDPEVLRIGVYAFRCIGPSFLPIVTAQIFPVFFQAAGLRPEKLVPDDPADGDPVCAAGVAAGPSGWAGGVLDGFSHHGDPDHAGGRPLLPAVSPTGGGPLTSVRLNGDKPVPHRRLDGTGSADSFHTKLRNRKNMKKEPVQAPFSMSICSIYVSVSDCTSSS